VDAAFQLFNCVSSIETILYFFSLDLGQDRLKAVCLVKFKYISNFILKSKGFEHSETLRKDLYV